MLEETDPLNENTHFVLLAVKFNMTTKLNLHKTLRFLKAYNCYRKYNWLKWQE